MGRVVDGGDIDEWLRAVGASLAAFDDFAGLYLHGSAASGDWVAGVSDVDLLVLWNQPLEDDRAALTDAIRSALIACPTRNADIHVVTLATAARPGGHPRRELYGGIHGIDAESPVLLGAAEDPNLLFDLQSARAHGVALTATSAPAAFGEVPLAPLLAAADSELAEWERYAYFRQPHMAALQAARAWMLASEGLLGSKLSAGRWALNRWPGQALLDDAVARQLGDFDVIVDEAEARALLAEARAAIRSRLNEH